ncbi:MAG: peptidoglycan DD-metalloendopeptidase family protein [Micropruina sp.]|uniref:peptidoglycan DD-metalloendopeptidase family protein n=1 Tax=Micropruina sp. TaxID=2737536 RepID=UPI0039E2F2B7
MSRTVVRLGSVLMVAWLLLLAGAPESRAFGSVRPVPGPVVRGYDPPANDWLPGHRGVDLAAPVGTVVRAAASGRVSVAQVIAGRGVVTIVHGELRTTYEPVRASVRVGDQVAAGDPIGTVEAGHCDGGCLHFGLKRGDDYLDPLGAVQVRLLPASAVAQARKLAAERAAALAAGAAEASGSGVLLNPVGGRISSPFGRRFHPIFHEWRLHAGVDLRASCGTPIRAAADGVVQSVSYDSSGGHRLIIAHAGGLTTHYLHAQKRYRVRRGQKVKRGQVVGFVGSTGWSTACHLHLTTKLNGRLVDPARYL